MNQNEPTTGNVAKALRVCFEKTCACSDCPFEHESCGNIEQQAADRLESQEQTIAALTARAESAEALAAERGEKLFEADAKVLLLEAQVYDEHSLRESAERERDAAIADLKFLDRCKTCFHAKTRHLIGSKCKSCKALSNFKWRGLPQDGEGK